MDFENLIIKSKSGDSEALETLLKLYQPLISSASTTNGMFDEDLYQELQFKFLKCIDKFVL